MLAFDPSSFRVFYLELVKTMKIDQGRALRLGRQALSYLETADPVMLEWARNVDFRNLTLTNFLSEYCWVVYASGFKVAIIQNKFFDLQMAFQEFEPAKLSRMQSIEAALNVFNNRRKAECFLAGAKTVIQEGFNPFRRRLIKGGVSVLESLPGIGPITKNHLAKNIGLADVAKADIWLTRAAKLCHADSVPELTLFVARKLGESQHVVDIAIWTFAKDKLLYSPR